MRELIELQRTLFTFLHVMATHDLSSVFLAPKSMTYIKPMTLLLLNTSCTHKDITVRKVCNTCPFGYILTHFLVHLLISLFLYWLQACVQIFIRLIEDWCPKSYTVEKVRLAKPSCSLSSLYGRTTNATIIKNYLLSGPRFSGFHDQKFCNKLLLVQCTQYII